jgi:hypothetical protein
VSPAGDAAAQIKFMTARKAFLLVVVLLEWFALIAQLVLHLQNSPAALGEALTRFFSFFTILTNLLICIYVTVQFVTPASKQSGFFFRPSTETAFTLYIVVVGLVYNTVLRQLWDSGGLQAVLHDILHSVVPIMILIYWWIWVNARALQYRHIPAWLIYPAVYALLVMIRGYFVHWYPYPFLDVDKLGYGKVLQNSGMLVLMFLLFSFGFVWLGRKKKA